MWKRLGVEPGLCRFERAAQHSPGCSLALFDLQSQALYEELKFEHVVARAHHLQCALDLSRPDQLQLLYSYVEQALDRGHVELQKTADGLCLVLKTPVADLQGDFVWRFDLKTPPFDLHVQLCRQLMDLSLQMYAQITSLQDLLVQKDYHIDTLTSRLSALGYDVQPKRHADALKRFDRGVQWKKLAVPDLNVMFSAAGHLVDPTSDESKGSGEEGKGSGEESKGSGEESKGSKGRGEESKGSGDKKSKEESRETREMAGKEGRETKEIKKGQEDREDQEDPGKDSNQDLTPNPSQGSSQKRSRDIIVAPPKKKAKRRF